MMLISLHYISITLYRDHVSHGRTRLLRNSVVADGSSSSGDELHAQLGGFALQILEHLLFVLVFIGGCHREVVDYH
jgi:hypothetical protein